MAQAFEDRIETMSREDASIERQPRPQQAGDLQHQKLGGEHGRQHASRRRWPLAENSSVLIRIFAENIVGILRMGI
jgi:hypothetical protein